MKTLDCVFFQCFHGCALEKGRIKKDGGVCTAVFFYESFLIAQTLSLGYAGRRRIGFSSRF